MARFKSIVTDAGAAALTALIAAGKPLILTHAAAGSGVATVSPNTLTGIVTPENVAVSLGEKDLIDENQTRRIARSIPGAKLLILPGETHGSYVVHSDKLYPAMANFLRG